MNHTISTTYVLAEHRIDVPEEQTQKYIEEIHRVSNDAAKSQNTNYIRVLPQPKLSSLYIWEQSNVFNDILDNIIHYSKLYSKDLPNLIISDCWSVVYKKGDYSTAHTHEGTASVLSFVFYVQNENKSPIEFIHGDKTVYPKTNTLLIFPNWVRHRVPPLEYDEERIVLAGNLMVPVNK